MFELKVEVVHLQVMEHHGTVEDPPAVRPKQGIPSTSFAFAHEHHIVNQSVIVVVEIDTLGNHVFNIGDGSFQQGKLAFDAVFFEVANGVGNGIVRLIVLFGIDIFVRKDHLAVGFRIEIRPHVDLVV